MSVWLDDYNTATQDLTGSVDLLNSYSESAKSATSKIEWDKYKNLYDSEMANYDNGLIKLEEATDNLNRYITYRKVSTTVVNTLSPRDKFSWLAGGLYNETLAGGSMYGGKVECWKPRQ
jgi:hypothetical protein